VNSSLPLNYFEMAEPDELYTLRNLFWLGSFQLAINEGNSLRLPANLVTEKEEYVYRSYLALGQFHIILGEIKDTASTPISLRAVKLLATGKNLYI
jgi:coatomer protein complex subunit epsilon